MIGKDADCNVVISDDEFVSRRHARLRLEDGLVFLEDLGSSNGTLLRIRRPIIIEAGDEILIGTRMMRLELRP
ncbi:MAG: FHA domain-containing protein [Planctomycetes bacterium]|nr:FHA domain-containing protein [Planctomycetota bacterium]